MLDVGWAELLVIAVVLIVVVGPKDLPRMLRTFGRTTQQMRRMAGDFRRQFDEALREAELDEVRQTMNEARKLNPVADVKKVMNPMRAVGDEIRSSLAAATRAPEPKVPAPDAAARPADPPPAALSAAAMSAAIPAATPAPATTPAPEAAKPMAPPVAANAAAPSATVAGATSASKAEDAA